MKNCSICFYLVFFPPIIDKNWKQLSLNWGKDKQWKIHITGYYSEIKGTTDTQNMNECHYAK